MKDQEEGFYNPDDSLSELNEKWDALGKLLGKKVGETEKPQPMYIIDDGIDAGYALTKSHYDRLEKLYKEGLNHQRQKNKLLNLIKQVDDVFGDPNYFQIDLYMPHPEIIEAYKDVAQPIEMKFYDEE